MADEFSAEKGTAGLLRLLTCGSVDDGKSTLIGRLLFDCRLLYDDQLAALGVPLGLVFVVTSPAVTRQPFTKSS